MGAILSRRLEDAVRPAGVIHNVFMGREAFSLGLMLAAHRAGRPFVFTPLRHQRLLGWSSPAFRTLYRSADALVALSVAESDWLVAHGAPRERIHVVGIGPLCNREASPDAARRLFGTQKVVLFLGQLHDYKGFRVLLEAGQRLGGRTDFHLVFAGPDVRGHARAFRSAGPRVTYLAAVDDALRDSLLQACTVLCVPSSRESFGGALVDAWQCGKPVIGGPAAATRELIEDGVDGWAVPQDPARIAQCLERLLDDEALGIRMGSHGRRKVETRFNWKTIADAHLDIYAGVVRARRERRS
jgi:glycosyltransferase involved in cell wall biosynthesis